jgi:hypothetical protein
MLFATLKGLMSHWRAQHPDDVEGVLQPDPTEKVKKIRGALDIGNKIKILSHCDKHSLFSNAIVAKQFGRTAIEIKHLKAHRALVMKYAATRPVSHRRRKYRLGRLRGPDFPISELELYKQFIHARFVLGVPQDKYNLRRNMREIVNAFKEGTEEKRRKFTYSDGWLDGFKKRHRITSQAKTEKKSTSFREREPVIKAFHWGIWQLQNIVYPLRDFIWGHWSPSEIYHMDQIPLPFCLNKKRSLNPRGTYCWIRDVGKSGLDKRQATIMLTLRAKGPQDIKCVLIVSGTGQQVPLDEIEFYKKLKHVKVYFQPKAWCGKTCMAWWVKRIWKKEDNPSRLLVLDNLNCHISDLTQRDLAAMNTHPLNPPPHCTDLVAPIGSTHTQF